MAKEKSTKNQKSMEERRETLISRRVRGVC